MPVVTPFTESLTDPRSRDAQWFGHQPDRHATAGTPADGLTLAKGNTEHVVPPPQETLTRSLRPRHDWPPPPRPAV